MHRFTNLTKNVTEAVTSAVKGAGDLASQAKDGLERALVAKCLRGYDVKQQIATGGPKRVWKIYSAEARNQGSQYPYVSVWLLDKKLLQDSNKSSKSRVWEEFLEQQRRNAACMIKLKHPGIIKLLEPLEETRTQFIMVTEPVFGSLDNVLHKFDGVPDVPQDVRNVKMPTLEIKHGLLQVADVLHFLHNEAQLAHCGISPESIFVGSDGQWRISGFGFSSQIDYTGAKKAIAFDYSDGQPPVWVGVSRPNLRYVAPELASGHGHDMSTNITPACDVFSLALVTYEALVNVPLINVQNELLEFKSKVASLSQIDLSTIPPQLQYTLRAMLSGNASGRPPASAFSASPFFQEDRLVRALVFLDGIVQRDNMQKASFIKDMESFWPQLEERVIRYKVLPHLLQEMQNPAMQGLVIPFVFKAVMCQDKEEFKKFTMPRLRAVLLNSKGDALLTILRHIEELAKFMTREMINAVLLPVFVHALDEKDARIQEEALRKIQALIEEFDYEPLKAQIIPRVHVICLRTSSAKVRVNSLVLMGAIVHRMDRDEAEKMLHTCAQVTGVDKTPGTLMCVLGVGDAVSKHWGPEVTAQKAIPLLAPLLVCKSLSHQQFGTYMRLMGEMLKRIEGKRGDQLKSMEPVASPTSKSDVTSASQSSLTNGWDAGPTKSTWASNPQPLSPLTTTSVPPAASPSWTSQPNQSIDALFSMSKPDHTPPTLPSPPKAHASDGMALFGDWTASSGTSGAGQMPSVGVGSVKTAQSSMGMDFGGFSGASVNPLGPMQTSQVNTGTSGLGTDFRDPSWQDPPIQPLSSSTSQVQSGIAGMNLTQPQPNYFSATSTQAASPDPFSVLGIGSGHPTHPSMGMSMGHAPPGGSMGTMGSDMGMGMNMNMNSNMSMNMNANLGVPNPGLGNLIPPNSQSNAQKGSGDPFMDLLS